MTSSLCFYLVINRNTLESLQDPTKAVKQLPVSHVPTALMILPNLEASIEWLASYAGILTLVTHSSPQTDRSLQLFAGSYPIIASLTIHGKLHFD